MTHPPSDLDLFGRTLPLHESVRPIQRPCLVCGLLGPRAVDAPHRLCAHCAEDLPKTRAFCERQLATVRARGAAVLDAWVQHQAELDDDTAERWTRLVQTRNLAHGALERALTGSLRAGAGETHHAAQIAEARRTLAKVEARIARTRTADAVMAALLDGEARYVHDTKQAQAEVAHWEIALQEIDAIEQGSEF